METELTLLQDIKTALWILISIVSIGVVATVIRSIVTSYRFVKTEIDNLFWNTASAMFESGELNKLVELCHNHLTEKPEEAYAHWFLGKAYFQMKELDKAKEHFNNALEIHPVWEKEWIGPFLDKIAIARDSSSTTDSSERS